MHSLVCGARSTQYFPALNSESIIEARIHALLALAVAWLLWSRRKVVIATPLGLAMGSGKRIRVIPWALRRDIRELPWIRVSPPWYPKVWQVDLDDDERFDFCGVRKARDVVIEFVKRAEASGNQR